MFHGESKSVGGKGTVEAQKAKGYSEKERRKMAGERKREEKKERKRQRKGSKHTQSWIL